MLFFKKSLKRAELQSYNNHVKLWTNQHREPPGPISFEEKKPPEPTKIK
jgi:hypothetical protein